MQNDNSKIVAVVVTYNRLELLKECIESIRNQTHKLDEIIIINNSSKDGTREWLAEQKDLIIITQENSGGAGGFYTGIKTAYKKGCDWIWCMDDDCMPQNDALYILIEASLRNNLKVIGPLVLDRKDHEAFAISLQIKFENKTHICTQMAEMLMFNQGQVLIQGQAAFFNGVLIHKTVIEKVGLPIKELFIWGDEIEYSKRIIANGIDLYTNVEAIVYHPTHKTDFKLGLFNHYVYSGQQSVRAFYFFRNSAFIAKKYNKWFNIKFIWAQLYYLLLHSTNRPRDIFYFLTSYYSGLVLKIEDK
jgi:GT2 family glycosyltransferase